MIPIPDFDFMYFLHKVFPLWWTHLFTFDEDCPSVIILTTLLPVFFYRFQTNAIVGGVC